MRSLTSWIMLDSAARRRFTDGFKESSVPHLTKGNVLDDVGFSRSKALEIKA